jgi:hypothetical protein
MFSIMAPNNLKDKVAAALILMNPAESVAQIIQITVIEFDN